MVWKKEQEKVGTTTIKKLNEICFTIPDEEISLSFTIKTANSPSLLKAAQDIKEQWGKIGVKVDIKELDSSEIKKQSGIEILIFFCLEKN